VRELLDQHRPKLGEPDRRHFEWHYLHRLCHSDLLTLKGQTANVNSVAFSPDGKRLASASDGTWDRTKKAYVGGEVKVWDAQTGQELLSLKGHTGAVGSVAFSPDGKRLAGGSTVWDAQTGQELLTIQGASGSVAFSPDGKRLAGAAGREVKVWEAQTGQELLSLQGHTSQTSVAFSPDGKRLASACRDNTVKVWDAQTGQELLSLTRFKESIYTGSSVAFSPDGKRLASIKPSPTSAVTIWDATPVPEKP
jgi:WD40 repeat protein